MTVESFQLLCNVGQFDSGHAGAQLALLPLTLIYAENGRGKTTLATVLRSPSTGESALIECVRRRFCLRQRLLWHRYRSKPVAESKLRRQSRSLPIIGIQESAEPLAAFNSADFSISGARSVDQPVVETLVVQFAASILIRATEIFRTIGGREGQRSRRSARNPHPQREVVRRAPLPAHTKNSHRNSNRRGDAPSRSAHARRVLRALGLHQQERVRLPPSR